VASRSARSIERTRKFYEQALKFAEEYPDISLWRCRKIAEIMLLENHRGELGEPGEKTATSVDELMKAGVNGGVISRLQRCNFETVQKFGNFGAHNQGGDEDDLSFHEIQPCLQATETLMRWWDNSFDDWVKENEEEKKSVELVVPDTTDADEEIEESKKEGRAKSVRYQMRKACQGLGLFDGGTVTLGNIIDWFTENYPNYEKSTIQAHVAMMTTNGESRLHHELKSDGSDELFFRISPGVYRIYDSETDPTPITEIEQYSGWEDKLAIVNCTSSIDAVSASGVYMSPHKGGNYKMQRARYIGLYKNKTVSKISLAIAKITFRRKKSSGYIYWCVDDSLDRNELCKLARSEIDSRWDGDFPIQTYILGPPIDINFRKDTKGGMFSNNRIIDISEIEHDSIEELVDNLNQKVWSDF
jgi:hypothetical protein